MRKDEHVSDRLQQTIDSLRAAMEHDKSPGLRDVLLIAETVQRHEAQLKNEHPLEVARLAAVIYAGANSYSVNESVAIARQIIAEAERTEP